MNTMIWKTLSTDYLSRHQYFTARKDRCLRDDGTIIDPYFVVELPTTATALAFTEAGEVILVRQYRHPIAEVVLETPGGFIDGGEDPIAGMQRELLEETGYVFSSVTSTGRLAANPALLNNFTEFYIARGGKKIAGQQLDRNEEIEIMLFSVEAVIAFLMEGKIKQSLHANCIFYGLIETGKLKFMP